eukprot:COSAG01_NODE_32601_length_578_cov_1.592902_2_plen_82_part_01
MRQAAYTARALSREGTCGVRLSAARCRGCVGRGGERRLAGVWGDGMAGMCVAIVCVWTMPALCAAQMGGDAEPSSAGTVAAA